MEKALPIIIVVGLVVVLFFVILTISRVWERRRRQAFQKLAEQLHFEFHVEGRAALMSELKPFHLFNIGHSQRMTNLLEGEASGTRISIFDFYYVTGGGKHRHVWNQSVFIARCEGLSMPLFSMRPESVWHRIGTLFGLQDIDFDSHPKFSKAYLLRGPDEPAIREFLSDEILDYFDERPGLNIEGHGDLILYAKYSRLAPDKIRDFMAEGFDILKVFQRS